MSENVLVASDDSRLIIDNLEIVIKFDEIIDQANKIENLSRYMTAQRINFVVSESQGSVAIELNEIIESYNLLGEALSKLFHQTSSNINDIAYEFLTKDLTIANALKQL